MPLTDGESVVHLITKSQGVCLFRGYALTHGPSRVRHSTCTICLECIDESTPSITHVGELGCQNSWCRECFLKWTRYAEPELHCPMCWHEAWKMPHRGFCDLTTGEVRSWRPRPGATYIVSDIPDVYRLLRHHAIDRTMKQFHDEAEDAFNDEYCCYEMNVDTAMRARELVENHQEHGLTNSDLSTLWRASMLLGVSNWSAYHFYACEGQVYVMPDACNFDVFSSLGGLQNDLRFAKLRDIDADRNDTGILHVPVSTKAIRRLYRANRTRLNTHTPCEDYPDWQAHVESGVELINSIAVEGGEDSWRILSIKVPNQGGYETYMVAVPWMNGGPLVHHDSYASLKDPAFEERHRNAARKFGWNQNTSDKMLKIYERDYRRDRHEDKYQLDEVLKNERLEWWSQS